MLKLVSSYRSVYDISTLSILHPGTGHAININQSIKTSLLGHDTCLVYDGEQGKQVSLDFTILMSMYCTD